jgi:hypothetical protein
MTNKTGRFLWIGRMRTKFFYKALAQSVAQLMFLMLLVPDLPVIGPMVAPRARAQGAPVGPCLNINVSTSGQGQIIQSICNYINPPGSALPGITLGMPPTADLQQFESDTVQAFLTLHGLPSTDAPLIYQYGRADLRAQLRSYLLMRLLSISLEPPSQRTANEQSVYSWFQTQMWIYEQVLFQTAIADHDNWAANPCGWAPDAQVASDYGLVYNGPEICNGQTSGTLATLFNIAPLVPSSSYYLAAALKNVYAASLSSQTLNQTNGTATQMTTSANVSEGAGIALAGGVAAGAATAAVLGATGTAASAVIFPFAGIAGAAAIGATAALGPLAVVLIFVIILILASFEVFNEQQTLNELAAMTGSLANIQANKPDIYGYFIPAIFGSGITTSDNTGMYKLTAAFTATTLPDYPSTAPLPAHGLTDLNFYLGQSNSYTPSLSYTDPSGATWTAQTYGGWFVQQCNSNCTTQTDSFTATLNIVDSSGTAWFASRAGAAFTLTKKSPATTDIACPVGPLGYSFPANPDKCYSYYTQTVPYKDANGNAGTFELNTAPTFTSGTAPFFTQGIAGTSQITASGAPLPGIDASGLPSGFTLTSSAAGTAQLNYDGTTPVGNYGANLSAIGGSFVEQPLTITVNPPPPQFTSPSTAHFTRGVPGSFTIQATGNPSPTLTVGSPSFPSVQTGLTFTANANGTATISGTVPLNEGVVAGNSISGFINATNANGSTQQTLTIDIGNLTLPEFVPPFGATFNAGVPNQATIVAQGSTLAAISNVCNTLPSWLTFTDNGNDTATISGTPPLNAPAASLLVIASPPGVPADYVCSGSGSNYTVNVVTTPLITSPDTTTFTVGTAGQFTATGISASDLLSLEGGLPQGLSYVPGYDQMVLSGTPAVGTGGVYPLTLTLAGGSLAGVSNVTQNFTLVVDEGPAFTSSNTINFVVNAPNSSPLTITGYPHTPIGGAQGMQVSLVDLPLTNVPIGTGLPAGVTLTQTTNSAGQGTGEWVLSGTPTAVAPYSFLLNANNGVGSSAQQLVTLNVVPPTIIKTTPVIAWLPPAAITYGTALSGTQLNATASIPGTFLYAPPAGTVLQAGNGETLSVTFMPADTVDYATATDSTTINVNPAPPAASGANLVVTKLLTRSGGNVIVQLTIANTGGTAAANVILTSVKVGADAATTLPQTLGIIGAGSSAQVTVTVPGTVGASGAASTLTLSGTYTGGTFSSTARITLP